MRSRFPPLNALRAFEAAARLSSFKAAASELGVTAGAVSQQVRILEDWFSTPLFERHNRRVVLTPAARDYLNEIGQAFDHIGSATEKFGSESRITLRINAPASFALRWLVPRLTKFQEECAAIRVRLETSNAPLEELADTYDVVIRGGPDTFYGYSQEPFLSEDRLPVCSPALLARRPLRSLNDLKPHTLLHSLSLPRLWGDWLAKAGVPDLRPDAELTLDHFYLTLQAALDGVGVAIGPTALIADDVAYGRLVAPFPDIRLPARSYCSYVPERCAENEAVSMFQSWLMREGNIIDPTDEMRSPVRRLAQVRKRP